MPLRFVDNDGRCHDARSESSPLPMGEAAPRSGAGEGVVPRLVSEMGHAPSPPRFARLPLPGGEANGSLRSPGLGQTLVRGMDQSNQRRGSTRTGAPPTAIFNTAEPG